MKRLSWNNAIYYGEVFGFLFAWAIGIVVALGGAHKETSKPDAKSIAAASPGGTDFD